MTRSLPAAPVRLAPAPPLPRGARKCWGERRSIRVLGPGTVSNPTSPPWPPSPPSGPPNSTNFSRRKLTAPGPPAPERTKIFAWSRKCIGRRLRHARRERKLGRGAGGAIEPAHFADDRVDEILVDLASRD